MLKAVLRSFSKHYHACSDFYFTLGYGLGLLTLNG
jgi:hypothetical protein